MVPRKNLFGLALVFASLIGVDICCADITLAASQPAEMGGTATTGTGVPTGQGPLTQPIPPAPSTLNPPFNSQRPQNFRGPTSTYPSPYPFGTR